MRRVINTFTAGELSPLMAGRLDLADVMARGSRRLKNFQIHPTGGIFRRSGLRYVGETKSPGTPAVLIPFQRDAHTVYQLEAGEKYLRVRDRNGTLTGADLIAPWSAADVSGLYYLQSNDVMLLLWNGPPQVLARTATGWTLTNFSWKYPPLRDENVTGTQLTCTVADKGATGFLEATEDLFQPGHAGSYWQLSHVRAEPYVKMAMGDGSADATALLSLTAQPEAGQEVSIATRREESGAVVTGVNTYKFVTGAPTAPRQVKIGTTAADTAKNLIDAINGEGDADTVGPGTAAHPNVTAENAGAVAADTKAQAVLTSAAVPFPTTTVTIGNKTYIFVSALSSTVPNQVRIIGEPNSRKPDEIAATLNNLIKAINATGTPGAEYSATTAEHTQVTALPLAGLSFTVEAKTVETVGSDVKTSTNSILLPLWNHPSVYAFTWSSPTLTDGATLSTERIRIRAKAPGAKGDGLSVSATLTNGSWSVSQTTGGNSVTAESGELRVTGKWEVFSVGEWTGQVVLEKKAPGGWEVLRTWTAERDYNIQASGEVAEETIMRLTFSGTGTVSFSPTFNAPNPRVQLTALSAEVKGIVRVKDNGFVTPRKVNVEVIKPLFLAAGQNAPVATARWAEGAFSGVRGYPRAACFHEQRLVVGGAQDEPERLHFSATADLFNFERTGLDDAGFAFDLAATESSPVVTLASMGDGLFCGTEGGEWLIKGGEGRAMTPSSRTALPKNAIGGAGIKPLVFGARVLFVQAAARALREFVFDWQDQNYVVPDLTDASAHLVRKGIRCIAFVRKPAPVIYAVTNDGHLLSCLYRRESQLVAWADHTTDGLFEWVSANTSPDTGDQVWFIINRDGKRSVEKFDDLHFDNLQYGAPADMLHCDAAITVEGTVSEVTTLTHLNGKEVVILADGKQLERATVSAGRVTLKTAHNKVTVGLPYVSEVQPMPVEIPLQDGVASGRMQKSGPLSVHLFRSLALRYADSAETPHPLRYEFNFRDGAHEGATAPPVFTGWRPMSPPAKFRDAAEVVLSTDEPLPLNILAIAPTSQVYGA